MTHVFHIVRDVLALIGLLWVTLSIFWACSDAAKASKPFRRRLKPPSAPTRLDLFERGLKDIAGEVPRGVLPASAVLGARSLAQSVLKQGRGLEPL